MTHELRLIIRGLALAMTTVCVWMGLWHQAEAMAVPLTPAATYAYAYDGNHLSPPSTYATPERGPPTSGRTAATYFADDHRSHGSSARPETRPEARLANDSYDCDNPALPMQADSTTRTISGALGTASGESCLLLPARVAANAGSKLLPKVDNAFQFPGAGRSGAGVKNFVGPPNTIGVGPARGVSSSLTSKVG